MLDLGARRHERCGGSFDKHHFFKSRAGSSGEPQGEKEMPSASPDLDRYRRRTYVQDASITWVRVFISSCCIRLLCCIAILHETNHSRSSISWA